MDRHLPHERTRSNIPPSLPWQLRQQSESITAQINKQLWDDTTGVYRNLDASTLRRGFSPRLSPTSFYPMIGGVASLAQVERMMSEHLTNVSEFCVTPHTDTEGEALDGRRSTGALSAPTPTTTCPFALPSISRADPSFWDNDYWRGRTWGPLNLLTWLGLRHPKYAASATVSAARVGLAHQSLALLLQEWRASRRVYENYNSTTGQGGDVATANPFYHWGALLGYIALREAVE